MSFMLHQVKCGDSRESFLTAVRPGSGLVFCLTGTIRSCVIQGIFSEDIARAVSLLFPPTLRRQQHIPRAEGMTRVVMIRCQLSPLFSIKVSHWRILKKIACQWQWK